MIKKLLNLLLNEPPPWLYRILWGFTLGFFALLIIHSFMGEEIRISFSLPAQTIEIQIGGDKSEIPAEIKVEGGKMFVNGVPIREWLESQGYMVIWDGEELKAIGVKVK